MIILFAMKNSLAARARTRRRPDEPFDRAARGVCVGDGGKMKTQNRRLGSADRQPIRNRRSTRRHRRGGKAAVTREVHRQPKTRAQLASSPFERRVCRANATIWAEPPAPVRLIASLVSAIKPLFGQNARSQGRRLSRRADSPPRRHPLRAASRHPTVLAFASLSLERDGSADLVRIRNTL